MSRVSNSLPPNSKMSINSSSKGRAQQYSPNFRTNTGNWSREFLHIVTTLASINLQSNMQLTCPSPNMEVDFRPFKTRHLRTTTSTINKVISTSTIFIKRQLLF